MKDATEIVVVMDKSGSMYVRATDAIGGFNSFIEDQKKEPGEAKLSLVLFDTTYSIPINGVPIKDVEPLTKMTYKPGGNTALNDALARAIIETGKRLADTPDDDRPDKVICVIITDGMENSSKEHTTAQVREMVEHQETKYNWVFVYLGTGVDSFAESSALGIDQQNVANFAPSGIGTRSAYDGTSAAVSSYRRGGQSLMKKTNWKDKVKN